MLSYPQVKKILKDEEDRVLRSKILSFTKDNSSLFALLCSIRMYFDPNSSRFERKGFLKNIQNNNLVESFNIFRPGFLKRINTFFQKVGNRSINATNRASLEITVDGVSGKITPFNIAVEKEYEGNNNCYSNVVMLAIRRYVEGIKMNGVCGILRSPEYLRTDTEDVIHCVVEKDGMINDMLRHCAFSKELYEKLFCFETLTNFSNEKIFNQIMFVRSKAPECIGGEGVAPYYFLANDDFMDNVKKRLDEKVSNADEIARQ